MCLIAQQRAAERARPELPNCLFFRQKLSKAVLRGKLSHQAAGLADPTPFTPSDRKIALMRFVATIVAAVVPPAAMQNRPIQDFDSLRE
jgi:hypothetical protein